MNFPSSSPARDATPRWIQFFIRRAAPPHCVEESLGDIEEVHRARVAEHGRALATTLTAIEAAHLAVALLRQRIAMRRAVHASAARKVAWLDHVRFSALDLKLGVRMLVKFPGLSLVSVFGMSLAIAIAAIVFSVFESVLVTGLPLPEGERIVALRNANTTKAGQHQTVFSDFIAWREQATSVQDLAAFTTESRNLVVDGVAMGTVPVVRMTASGFTLARTAAIRGRPLLADDERTDARVIVIAYDEWQRRFAADPGIVGRQVSLGRDVYTIVGVMPKAFRFPVNDRYWIPLPTTLREHTAEVPVAIAGRLSDGVTLERAQVDLTTIGTRMAAAQPYSYAQLRPQVLPYTRTFFEADVPQTALTLWAFRLFFSLLLVVVAVNVAVLMYARTAARAGEIAVRTALGASRARVVTQLFAEALALSGTAALVGLAIAGVGLSKLQPVVERRMGELPFWMHLQLSPTVIAYALALAIVGAAIVGVAPALKATGHRVLTNLQQLSGKGATSMQLGRAWTALIVGQVAIAVAVLPFATHFTQEEIADATTDPGYAAEEFLETTLITEQPGTPADSTSHRRIKQRFAAGTSELISRLKNDPQVAGLTIRSTPSYHRYEVEIDPSSGALWRGNTPTERVDTDFFSLYDMPILAGRTFVETDRRPGAMAVVVNQVFAENHFERSSALGRRLRFVGAAESAGTIDEGSWLEIVGVVRDFASNAFEPQSKIYLPINFAELDAPLRIAMHVRAGAAATFAPRLREIAVAVDPQLQPTAIMTAAERHRQGTLGSRYLAIGTTAAMLSVLLLSTAGIYAMMSFTVARRRREIGIRSALGADSRRVLGSIFRRASAQISMGIMLGIVGTFALDRAAGRGPIHDGNLVMVPLVAVLVAAVALMASILPARRGLAVHPTEALRAE